MKYENQSMQQQIEAYLRQEMTDLERSGFERRMHDDEELHEEVHKQEAIMEAIRRERVIALKAGLQNVPVSLWSGVLMEAAKIAAVSIGIGLASAGGYLYFQNQKAGNEIVATEANKETQPEVKMNKSSGAGLQPSNKKQEEQMPEAQIPIAQDEEKGPDPEVRSAGAQSSSSFSRSSADLPVRKESLKPLQETDLQEPSLQASQLQTSGDPSLPEDGFSNNTKPESLQPEVLIKRDNKEKFHYQFSDGKLVLYADFSNKLYEVLELNQYGDRQLFLAYDGKFFALDSRVAEITPLREVKDTNLIQILTNYQKRK
jgi:hypothetical protein